MNFILKDSKGVIGGLRDKLGLIFLMICVGSFTFYAAVNSYEAVAKKDLPYSNVIKGINITSDQIYNKFLTEKLKNVYDEGSFGVPKKIKFSERSRHIDIVDAIYVDDWKASSGVAHVFVIDDERQKAFGKAIIYMRVNTNTTRDIGDLLIGDIVNIVTTEGWQLGYRVTDVSDDAVNLRENQFQNNSEIIVILVDNKTFERFAISAVLERIGERT